MLLVLPCCEVGLWSSFDPCVVKIDSEMLYLFSATHPTERILLVKYMHDAKGNEISIMSLFETE